MEHFINVGSSSQSTGVPVCLVDARLLFAWFYAASRLEGLDDRNVDR